MVHANKAFQKLIYCLKCHFQLYQQKLAKRFMETYFVLPVEPNVKITYAGEVGASTLMVTDPRGWLV